MVYHYALEMTNAIDQQSFSPYRRLYTLGLRFVSCFDSADHHVSPGLHYPEFIMGVRTSSCPLLRCTLASILRDLYIVEPLLLCLIRHIPFRELLPQLCDWVYPRRVVFD
jgi:hypothetical protein